MGCSVIGRKFAGLSWLSFLWIRIVKLFFHTLGITFFFQQCTIIRCKTVRIKGQCFNTKILIWSNGHAEDPDFIRFTTLEISWYVGGDSLNGCEGSLSFFIHCGISKSLFLLLALKLVRKKSVHMFSSKSGSTVFLSSNISLQYFQKFSLMRSSWVFSESMRYVFLLYFNLNSLLICWISPVAFSFFELFNSLKQYFNWRRDKWLCLCCSFDQVSWLYSLTLHVPKLDLLYRYWHF